MKLFIWEGDGVSGAWHDDGTVVVLAESPEHARQIVWDAMDDKEMRHDLATKARDKYCAEIEAAGKNPNNWLQTERGKEIWAMFPFFDDNIPDGTRGAFKREPDRVVELDKPCIVAFNGGGYD